jgi:hypothetical protein
MEKALSGIELARSIDLIKQQMPLHIQAQTVKAELYYTYFQSLIKEGFTETQALAIIKSRGLD